jgi:inner membrane protein
MLFHTHIILGIVVFLFFESFFSGGNAVVFFFLVLLGSILPDIDEKHSKINRWTGIIGIIIAFFFKHRGLFHSVVLHGSLFVLLWKFFDFYYGAALFLGYFAHLLGDGITRMGVPIFYPFSNWKIRGPVRVGGWMEGVIFFLLFVLIVKILFS